MSKRDELRSRGKVQRLVSLMEDYDIPDDLGIHFGITKDVKEVIGQCFRDTKIGKGFFGGAEKTVLEGCKIVRCVFGSKVSLNGLHVSDCDFRYTQLNGLRGASSFWIDVDARWLTMEDSVMASSTFREVDFVGSSLRGSDFSDSDLAGSDFSETDLTNVNLRGANLAGCDLRGADLSGVNLAGATFRRTLFDRVPGLAFTKLAAQFEDGESVVSKTQERIPKGFIDSISKAGREVLEGHRKHRSRKLGGLTFA